MLDKKMEQLAEDMGADFFGVGDLSPAHEAILAQGGAAIAGFPRAVSVGMALSHGIVDQLPQRFSTSVALNYNHHGYGVINQRLDHLSSRLAGVLQCEGYRSLPIPATQEDNYDHRLCGIFPHKTAARLSGLGWIGKSCLLITPEVGPRARWATVLTNAPLRVTGGPMEERCGDCQECVDICPQKAFTGRPFEEDEPRELRYEAHKCDGYLRRLEDTSARGACGMCVYVCPHGRKGRDG